MSRIPEKVGGVDAAALKLSAQEAYLLMLVDGHASSDDIAAASGMSVSDVDAALDRLAGAGVIRISDGPLTKVAVGRMTIQRIALGTAPTAGSVDDPREHLARGQAALARGNLAEAREHYNLAWMADPGSVEVARFKTEIEAREKAAAPPTPPPTATPTSSSGGGLVIPDANICKNPKARSFLLTAIKKAGTGDYGGAFRDLQTATMMEAGNTRLAQFRDDVDKLRKAQAG
ncbi:MAG: hypothetical protein AB2A00_15060 [Myxococcota bacterium]